MNMKTKQTEFGRVCEAFPDGSIVEVGTTDGRTFAAISDGDGGAWVGGNLWLHPAAAVPSQAQSDGCNTWEVAKRWNAIDTAKTIGSRGGKTKGKAKARTPEQASAAAKSRWAKWRAKKKQSGS